MSKRNASYRCRGCGAVARGGELSAGAWGDQCCPSCGSPDLERQRARRETLYGIFFLYKVY